MLLLLLLLDENKKQNARWRNLTPKITENTQGLVSSKIIFNKLQPPQRVLLAGEEKTREQKKKYRHSSSHE